MNAPRDAGSFRRQSAFFTNARSQWFGLAAIALVAVTSTEVAHAAQLDIVGPSGSVAFGAGVTVLPNGNIVVVDPDGRIFDRGTVYLYRPDGTLISTLSGASSGDRVGSGGVTVLANGNYVISSPTWRNDLAARAGAVTWANGDVGVSGTVSASNSLVGSSANDLVGEVTSLPNGHYVVRSTSWDNGLSIDAGAVTWGNGAIGRVGLVSEANSLVGTAPDDRVGTAVTVLANSNYVVASAQWDKLEGVDVIDAGAATWGNGVSGISGTIASANSLIGSRAADQVGSAVVALTNGNYVVVSSRWDNGVATDVGAVTWGNGGVGISGAVASTNSFIGASSSSRFNGVVPLANGHYVISSPNWDNGAMSNVGAVTWASGSSATVGVATTGNSLTGTSADNEVGQGVLPLSNGHYVVLSHNWDGPSANVGAATWVNGTGPTSGVVSAANSVIGATIDDRIGNFGAAALTNGHYVLASPFWGSTDLGAVTWASGTGTTSAIVSASNSLIGVVPQDLVGLTGVVALTNGNYVVGSRLWNNGGVVDAGAATWGNGSTGTTGLVSTANSLVGSSTSDYVSGTDFGSTGTIVALSDGNYLVRSSFWNSPLTNAGAVTWGNGAAGTTGSISAANSLIGTSIEDRIGALQVRTFNSGRYVFPSLAFDYAASQDVGAVTAGRRALSGVIDPSNSVIGTVPMRGNSMSYDFDAARSRLVVGRPASNIVTLADDNLFSNGFE